jgi:hypothetical protein
MNNDGAVAGKSGSIPIPARETVQMMIGSQA